MLGSGPGIAIAGELFLLAYANRSSIMNRKQDEAICAQVLIPG